MNLEEIIWRLLSGEASSKELKRFNDYELYYIYSILYKLRNRINESLKKYQVELSDYLLPLLKIIDEYISEIYPRVKNMYICYALQEASDKLSKKVAGRIFEKILMKIPQMI